VKMRRGLVFLIAGLAFAAAAPASAQEPVIADDVTVAGVAVGGMTEEEATAAVQASFDRLLLVRLRRRELSVTPKTLGARARVYAAVQAALAAPAATSVRLEVIVNPWKLRRWTRALANRFHRAPKDSVVVLRGTRPWISQSARGKRLLKSVARRALKGALLRHSRGPVRLPTRVLKPSLSRANFGPVVVVRRDSRRLVLYRGMSARGMRVVAAFGVAVGQPAWPTPIGRFTIRSKQRNPWWYPPDRPWAAGASPVPPGPGNPLGTRWMGLSIGGVGIHGTYNSGSIGTAASHGCIRMHISESEWLFERVRIGTTVFIVRA
jgi:hypothetical protein